MSEKEIKIREIERKINELHRIADTGRTENIRLAEHSRIGVIINNYLGQIKELEK